MHKDKQKTSFFLILQGTTFISPKGESPKIPTMHKIWAFPPKKKHKSKFKLQQSLHKMNRSYTIFYF
jgi:hypothetical protein